MKKHLIAAGVVAAFAAPAMAQSVELYGIFDLGYAVIKDKNAGIEQTGPKAGGLSGNRIGFRGTEDLGGGMKASFAIETGFDPTGTAGLFAARDGSNAAPDGANTGFTTGTTRQAWTAIGGSFGEFKFGRQYTTDYWNVLGGLTHPISEGYRGATSYTYGYTYIGTRYTGASYTTPSMSGLQFVAHYGNNQAQAAGQTFDNIKDDQIMNLAVNYTSGPLYASLTYGSLKSAKTASTDAQQPESKTTNVYASYDFKVARAAFSYGQKKSESKTGAETADIKHYQASIIAPVPGTAFNLIGSYGNGKNDTAGSQTDVTSTQLGATYVMSKRTTFYSFWGKEKDDKALASSATKELSSFGVGLRHTF